MVDIIVITACWVAAAVGMAISTYDPAVQCALAIGATFSIMQRRMILWAISDPKEANHD